VLLLGLIGLGTAVGVSALDKKAYKVYIVSDTLGPWALDAQAGFRETLDKQLAAEGAQAAYTVFDTKVDPAAIPAILTAIQNGKPDLVLTCNYPNGFADSQVTAHFPQAPFKFVSLNPIPVETGLIKSWQKPGGNVTGVGVFLQFTSSIKLALKINPRLKKVAFVTWSTMGIINDWFESEMKKAVRESGITLVEFRRIANNEEELDFYRDYVPHAADTFVMGGISAFVHKDGSPVDSLKDWNGFIQKDMGQLLYINYDETTVARGIVAGATVIWSDIGAQMAEKAMKVLQGATPGDLPWEYPRKYNIVLNVQAAKDRSITLPPSLISSAYRVYTDYKGNFVGAKD
jgi:putative ABC transport system substrate-binding protein